MTSSTPSPIAAGRVPGVGPAFLRRLKRDTDAHARNTPIDVFVMGPGKRNLGSADAALLRRELIKRCQDEGHSAYAEHKAIRAQVSALGPGTDLCTLEVAYANQVDLLVFIPSSHGAAAEIGYFAALGDRPDFKTTARSLVLLDKAFGRQKGFVVEGPVKVLQANGAVVKRVDLTDHDAAWKHVKKLIDEAKRRKLRNKAIDD